MGIMEYFSRKKENRFTFEQLEAYLNSHYFAKANSLLNGNVSYVNEAWVDELAQTIISKGKEIQLATKRWDKNDKFEEASVLLMDSEQKYDVSFEEHYKKPHADAIAKVTKQKHLSPAQISYLLGEIDATHKEVTEFKEGLNKKIGAMHVTLYAARLSSAPEQAPSMKK